jgi:uncharacterized membrane protein YjgN (DUF898 family)
MENSPADLGATLAGQNKKDSASTQLHIRFTGSGSEYFRIWIVNLLLVLVTLGLYFPWAKVRRLRYFYGNTLVAGEPLGFHGNPKKMFKGFVLVGVLFGLYSVAGNFSPTAGLIAFLIVVVLWPALFKSAMQFRMANTSWRGLQFRFCGTLAGAYRASIPLFVPGILIVCLHVLQLGAAITPTTFGLALGAILLATLLLAPWLLWNLKKFQHNNYAFTSLQTSFRASPGSFYRIGFQAIGIGILAVFSGVVVMAICAWLGGVNFDTNAIAKKNPLHIAFIVIAGTTVAYLAVFLVIKPFAVSRTQNLVWTQTGNASFRFVSMLSFKSLLWMTLKNWVLIVFTLGLYWPFASIALTRLRVESVSVITSVEVDTLVSQIKATEGEAAGDAAGDFFELDVGL